MNEMTLHQLGEVFLYRRLFFIDLKKTTIMKNNSNLFRKILPAAIILFAICGILIGVTDYQNYDYIGFQSDTGRKTIIKIDKDSPTKKTGFQLGDFVVKADWGSIDDRKEWSDYQRTLVGETRVYEIEKRRIPEVEKLTFALRSIKGKILDYFATLLGFPDYRLISSINIQ